MARTAMITGAAGRIGTAVAEALSADGWSLVLVARAAADPRLARFPAARVLSADLADPAAVRALGARAAALQVDALIHCAGRFREGPLLEEDATVWRIDVAVEAEALHGLATALVPGMRDRGFGRLVALGLAGLERWPGYQTATGLAVGKAAALVVARALALTLAADPITVNVVAPGVVGDGAPASLRTAAPGRVASRRPEEIAAVVRFLLTDAAGAVTGAIVPAAGGAFGLRP